MNLLIISIIEISKSNKEKTVPLTTKNIQVANTLNTNNSINFNPINHLNVDKSKFILIKKKGIIEKKVTINLTKDHPISNAATVNISNTFQNKIKKNLHIINASETISPSHIQNQSLLPVSSLNSMFSPIKSYNKNFFTSKNSNSLIINSEKKSNAGSLFQPNSKVNIFINF